jgi:hypothetical protein
VFERGFKAWCERFSGECRKEMRLSPTAPISAHQLAKLLEITIWTPQDIPELDEEALSELLRADAGWSATTICCGDKNLIVINPNHSPGRQSSDLMHEMAHLLLGHPPARPDITEDGLLMLNTYNKEQEEQADWFGAAILLPRDAVLAIVRSKRDLKDAAREYGVSEKLLTWRINATGVRMQLQRSRR